MKKIFSISVVLIFSLSPLFTVAQTKRIALQSHSGSMKDIAKEKDGNFGLPMPSLKKDSTVAKSDTTMKKPMKKIKSKKKQPVRRKSK